MSLTIYGTASVPGSLVHIGPRQLPGPFHRHWLDTLNYMAPDKQGACAHREDAESLAALTRRLDCARYDSCLSLAAKHGWRGFDCMACARRISNDG